jgi:hypothetical protein
MDDARVPYDPIDLDATHALLQDMRLRGAIVWYRPEGDFDGEGYRQVFTYQYKPNAWWRLYVTWPEVFVSQGRSELLPERRRRLDIHWTDTVLSRDDEIDLIQVDSRTANHYRLLWTKKATMRNAANCWLLIVAGRVTGVVCLNDQPQMGLHDLIPLFADAACTWTRYKRLGRLVLMCILTDEFMGRIRDQRMVDYRGFTTVAYSNKPVSMKYRGLFDLAKRDDGSDSNCKYALKYHASKMQAATIRDAYHLWLKRYGDQIK